MLTRPRKPLATHVRPLRALPPPIDLQNLLETIPFEELDFVFDSESFQGTSIEEDWIPSFRPLGFTRHTKISEIFQVLWWGVSESMVTSTNTERNLLDGATEKHTIDVEGLNLFLGSLLVTGLVPEPTVNHYFTDDLRGIFRNKWMGQQWTRDKWHRFHSNIHVKHQECIQLLRTNIQANWNPSQILVVDEMILPFEGRWAYRQFVRGKPHNTGLKVYTLVDQAGVLFDFWLYEGPDSEDRYFRNDQSIVLGFLEMIEANQNPDEEFAKHIFIGDSYFGDISTVRALHNRGYGGLFTTGDKKASNIWNHLQFRPKKHAWRTLNTDDIVCCTYFDKAKVNLVSNLASALKERLDKNRRSVPNILQLYRERMGAGD